MSLLSQQCSFNVYQCWRMICQYIWMASKMNMLNQEVLINRQSVSKPVLLIYMNTLFYYSKTLFIFGSLHLSGSMLRIDLFHTVAIFLETNMLCYVPGCKSNKGRITWQNVVILKLPTWSATQSRLDDKDQGAHSATFQGETTYLISS